VVLQRAQLASAKVADYLEKNNLLGTSSALLIYLFELLSIIKTNLYQYT
jgi:hypothetical protein